MPHISLGAINKLTGEYVYPKIANKKDKYICPECNKDLILCQGKIKAYHFRHKVDSINPCHHYSNPTETQIHKDAKILLKKLLETKNQISFIRNCSCCKKKEEFEIPEIIETSVIQLEHRFEYKGVKIADVAYIDDNEITCIFEICNTHKTSSENRPEPWFEINAETLIKIANDSTLSSLQIPCVRCEKCDDCIKEFAEKEEAAKKKTEIENISPKKTIYRRISSDINEKKYVYLKIDFSKKDMIKEYGGKWKADHKLWYITKTIYNKNKNYIDEFVGDKIEWFVCSHCNGEGSFEGESCWFCQDPDF